MNYPSDLRLLALDMATRCGFATLTGGVLTSGSQSFARGARSHPGTPHGLFDNWLRGALQQHKPDLVIYESAGFFRSGDAVQICVGMRGVMLAQTAKLGIPVVDYSPTSVKLFWAGGGRAEKSEIMAATRRRCPQIRFADDNESDAIALLHLHLSKIGVEELQLLAP